MPLALDLAKCHFERNSHGLRVYGTWWYGHDSGVPRPCLVLLPAHWKPDDKTMPVVVLQDEAWIWSPAIGNPIEAMRRMVDYAMVLNINTADPRNVARIGHVIQDHLGDLLNIPPLPESEKVVVADAVMIDESGRERHHEITDWHN